MFCIARPFMNLLFTFSSTQYEKTSLQINLFRDEITSMYFNQKAINNDQSHYQTNILELTLLLHLMMVSIQKSKEILLVTDDNCSQHFVIWKSYQYQPNNLGCDSAF